MTSVMWVKNQYVYIISDYHCCCCCVASVLSDSVRPHREQPTRLPHPWDPPGKNTGVGCHFLLQCMKVNSESEVTQSCPTLTDPMDCSLPGSSVHGIFQARVLEWSAIAFFIRLSLGSDKLSLMNTGITDWNCRENHIFFFSIPKLSQNIET